MGRRVRRLQGACRATTLTRTRRAATPADPHRRAPIVVVVVALDQVTKAWAVDRLRRRPDLDHRQRRRAPAEPQHRRCVQPVPGVHAAARGARGRDRGRARARGAPRRRPRRRSSRSRSCSAARRQPDRPRRAARRGSCAARSSTSSASAAGRRSTSPTARSRSARCCSSCHAVPALPRDDDRASRTAEPTPTRSRTTRHGRAARRARGARRGAGRPRGRDAHRLEPRRGAGAGRRRRRSAGRAAARRKSRRLAAGEVVELLGAPPAAEPLRARRTCRVDVRYEDDDLVVVAKPAGLVVHPGAGHAHGTLVHGLLARVPGDGGRRRPGPSRDRAPARPRHERAAGRGALGRRVRRPRRHALAAATSSGATSRSCGAGPQHRAGSSTRRSAARPAAGPGWRCATAGGRPAPGTRSSGPAPSPA